MLLVALLAKNSSKFVIDMKPIFQFKYLFFLLLLACNNSDKTEKIDASYPLDGISGQLGFNQLRLNPPGGQLPPDIRKRELDFAKKIKSNNSASRAIGDYIWKHRGPINVGGRTRALVQDITNDNIIIAGGVSGGLWRSTDKGLHWDLVIDKSEQFGISHLIQDTRPGFENMWYYGTGEALGNSASDYAAYYLGNGMYVSSDSGKTWQHLEATKNRTPTALSTYWDFIHFLAIDPSISTSTNIYAACFGGILKSRDGGQNWETVLDAKGFISASFYSDVKITSNGNKFAYISSDAANNDIGFWKSESGDVGDWIKITPEFAPAVTGRMILEIDEDQGYLYAFGNAGENGHYRVDPWHNEDTTWCSFWRYDIANDSWEDLSMNLPNSQKLFGGINIQGGFDLVCEVHPENSNHIFIGGTNLFLSTDGANSNQNWKQIGGYRENAKRGSTTYRYPDHHPDQHVLIFDRSQAKSIISGHDGGVSITSDYSLDSVEWQFLTNGYYTTQCHAITVNENAIDSIILAGLQDNGTVYTGSKNITKPWTMAMYGDGSYGAISNDGMHIYLSSQNGNVSKVNLYADGSLNTRSRIDPEGTENVLFINPFILDPNDDNIMYYLGGRKLYRQNDLSAFDESINQFDKVPLTKGWDIFRDTLNSSNGVLLTTLKATKGQDRRLYLGALGHVYRIDNPHIGDPEWLDISGDFNSNAFVSDIAIDPRDPDKFAVVFSNYKVYSLYYSQDGGETYSKVAGNLEERSSGGGNGPSLRSMVIHPLKDGKTAYILATSVGVFATDTLLADSTVWSSVAPNDIGNVVVEMVKSRQTDHTVYIGTHGAGVFSATIDEYWKLTGVKDQNIINNDVNIRIYPNPSSDYVYIDTDLPILSWAIYDQQGRLMKNEFLSEFSKSLDIDFRWLEKGIYFLNINTEKGICNQAIIKQ